MEIKIGIVSDLHTEFWSSRHFEGIGKRVQKKLADADLILLAGDISVGVRSVETAQLLFPHHPVCLVAGNHEFYRQDYEPMLEELRAAAIGSNVHFLNRDVFEIELHGRNLRVLGTTLWTDFAVFGDPAANMWQASRGLNDFRLIRYEGKLLTPQDTLDIHNVDKAWILGELDKPFDGTTIVMTHHSPVSFGSSPQYANDAYSPCFNSKLEDTFTRDDIALVVWGHTHFSVDQTIVNTRFVSSQTGYESGMVSVETADYGTVITL